MVQGADRDQQQFHVRDEQGFLVLAEGPDRLGVGLRLPSQLGQRKAQQRADLGETLPPGADLPYARYWGENGRSRAYSLREALQLNEHHNSTIWVIGGAQIYAQALPLADCVEVTEIGQDFDGDAYAPTLGPEWKEAAREHHTSASGLPFCFVRYLRAA